MVAVIAPRREYGDLWSNYKQYITKQMDVAIATSDDSGKYDIGI